MAGSTPNLGVCAFCGLREQNKDTGLLLKTSDDKITAHLNCTIFSPKVITTDSCNENFGGFDINSVKEEIKRGTKTKCKLKTCGKFGATIGCDNEDCRKTYHYMCAKNDGAKIINNEEEEKYIIYCKHHTTELQLAPHPQAQPQAPQAAEALQAPEAPSAPETPPLKFSPQAKRWAPGPPADEGPSGRTEDVGTQTSPGWTDPTLQSVQEDLDTIKAQLAQLQGDIRDIKGSKP